MALRRCWRLAGLVPRLLCHSYVPPGASVGRRSTSASSFVNTYRGYKNTEFRRFSSQPLNLDVSYDELKKLLAEQKAVVIDVREPWELREYGFIPGSINVPLGHVSTAFQLDPDEFREKYDAELPQQMDNIVFICLAGVRSKAALNIVSSLGFKVKDRTHWLHHSKRVELETGSGPLSTATVRSGETLLLNGDRLSAHFQCSALSRWMA